VTFYVSNSTVISRGCLVETGATTTSSTGAFGFEPVSPASTCVPNGTVCTAYYPPQAPVYLQVADGLPPGYAQNASSWYPPIALQVVDELNAVTISSPSPTFTTSVGALLGLTAAGVAANGTPTPLAATYAWSLNGTGWSFVGSATGASVNLTAVPGAGAGTVTVVADADSRGVVVPPVTARDALTAIPTAIETGETNRTSVDAGSSVGFELTAVGASGYSYAATIEPGLGLSSVAAPCTPSPTGSGAVDLSCSADVVYPAAGTAAPAASLTNGYSAGSWRFPDVTVSPPPELEVSPAAPVGYALAPVELTVAAASGSGAEPFQRGCLELAGGPPLCDATAGPNWTFAPTFEQPGAYPAVAWAVDADGTNASRSFAVDVVAPLAVGPVATIAGTPAVDSPVQLRANLSGGLLPARYWWNASGGAGTLLDGTATADGPMNLTWVPDVAGPSSVALTVVDRLGTAVTSTDLIDVGPAPAERIAAVTAAPAGPVTVGTPVPLSWGAYTSAGGVDPDFAASIELELGSPEGAPVAWVNSSGAGPLAALGNGSYGVPASAWVDGLLSVNLTLGTAREVSVTLSGAALPATVAPMELVAAAELSRVHLVAPDVVRTGTRDNATLWHVVDGFGNAAPGARLTITLAFGATRSESVVVAEPLPGGASGVWVNYTALASGPGLLTVSDAAGTVVLGPIEVPTATAPAPAITPVDALATVVPVAAAGAAGFGVARRRRRLRAPGAATEAELRRLAEGRDRIVELVRRAGAADLATLEAGWEPPPAPAELADWVASLVADGSLGATLGDDRIARFCLAGGRPSPPRPTFDPEALERSLRHRDETLADGDPPPP
jgi:hypothetical protein